MKYKKRRKYPNNYIQHKINITTKITIITTKRIFQKKSNLKYNPK